MGAINRSNQQPNLDPKLEELERRIDALDRIFRRHAPRGMGFDGLVGHKSEAAATETTKKGNSIYIVLPNPRYGGDGSQVRSFTVPRITGHLEFMWSEGPSSLTHVTRALSTDGARHSFTEYVNEEATTTHTATPSEDPAYALTEDSMGATAGDFLICVYSTSAPALVMESLSLSNFDGGTVTWSAITLSGANQPPALNGGLYWMGVNETMDKVVVAHSNKLYWGDITNSTTIDFSTTPTTMGITLPTTGSLGGAGFGCDGEEVLVAVIDSSNSRTWDVERYLFEGSSAAQTIDDMLMPSGDPGLGNGPTPMHFLTYEGVWCAALRQAHGDSGHIIVSLELVDHG